MLKLLFNNKGKYSIIKIWFFHRPTGKRQDETNFFFMNFFSSKPMQIFWFIENGRKRSSAKYTHTVENWFFSPIEWSIKKKWVKVPRSIIEIIFTAWITGNNYSYGKMVIYKYKFQLADI